MYIPKHVRPFIRLPRPHRRLQRLRVDSLRAEYIGTHRKAES